MATLVAAAASPGGAFAQAAARPGGQEQRPCAPDPAAAGATIRFGHEGGSLRPRAVAIYANGLVRAGGDTATDSVKVLSPAAVAAVARLAHTGGFWTLRSPAIRRPPANPDATRQYIAVSLTCGSRRAEYPGGTRAPSAFTELQALLEALVSPGG